MNYKTGLLVAAVCLTLSGCIVTDQVDKFLDDKCTNTRADCHNRAPVEKKAREADRALYHFVKDGLTQEADAPLAPPPYHDPNALRCEDGQKKVCSANAGCHCESR